MKHHFETLGLQEDASQEEIQATYDRLSKELNPLNNDNQEFFKEEYDKVQEAYKALSNSSILGLKTAKTTTSKSNNDLNAIKKDKKIVKEDTNSLKDILKRKLYLIILVIFSILYVVTSIIDNNAYRPDFLLSEFTVIAAFFVLVTLFSIKAVSRKYKLKKIIAREILYLICSFLLAVIMFGIHSYVYNSYDETITEMEDAISKCEINVSNLKSQEDYNLSNLSELGFNPVEKEYYISDFLYLNERLKKTNSGVQYISSSVFYNFRNQNEYDRIIDEIGAFTQLSSITNNSSDRIYFNDTRQEMYRSNYILGAIKLKKKKPIYESYFRTFNIGIQTTPTDIKNQYGLEVKTKYSLKTKGYEGDGYGICYYDKKDDYFVRTNLRSWYEKTWYGKTGFGCSTWLCGSKKTRDDYYMKYTPANTNILESPAIIEKDDFDERYNASFYKKANIITLKKDSRGVINPKKDKIEASITDVQPSLFDGGDGDWSLIILFLAYVYRAINSIITGVVFFIRWLIRTSISN
jgi:multisubunit Na+/H+ antiporter MnhB subunit